MKEYLPHQIFYLRNIQVYLVTFLQYFCETKDDPKLVKVLHSKAVGNGLEFRHILYYW